MSVASDEAGGCLLEFKLFIGSRFSAGQVSRFAGRTLWLLPFRRHAGCGAVSHTTLLHGSILVLLLASSCDAVQWNIFITAASQTPDPSTQSADSDQDAIDGTIASNLN